MGDRDSVVIGELVVGSGGTALDLALMAWLDAKTNRSGSPKTATAYTATIASFRRMLQQAGTDLDGDVGALSLLAQAWAGQGTPSPATFNQRLAIISSFYSFAMKRGLLNGNPIARVERRSVEAYAGARAIDYSEEGEEEPELLHPAEYTRMLPLAGGNTLDYAILQVFLQTGCGSRSWLRSGWRTSTSKGACCRCRSARGWWRGRSSWRRRRCRHSRTTWPRGRQFWTITSF